MNAGRDVAYPSAVDGRRLGFDEGVELFRSASLLELGRAADAVCRRLHPEPFRTYNIDRNLNYTNVCAAVCDFCAFYRQVGDTDAYVLDRDVLGTDPARLGDARVLLTLVAGDAVHEDPELEA